MKRYTEEEKRKAVELLEKYDGMVSRTIRELGYPKERHVIKEWARRYGEYGKFSKDHPVEHTYSHIYTDEKVEAAVSYYMEHGKNLSNTARRLGYPENVHTLKRWIGKLHPNEPDHEKHIDTQKRYDKHSVCKAISELSGGTGKTVDQIALESGVSRGSVYYWKKKLCNGEPKKCLVPECDRPPESGAGPTEDAIGLKEQVSSLRAEIHRLRLQKDLLETAVELIKKDEGICLETLTNREKATVIDALRKTYKVAELIDAVGIARSTYFAQIKAMRANDKYFDLRDHLRKLFEYSYGCYGYRRLHTLLKEEGIRVSEKVVRRLMKEENIHVPSNKKEKKFNSYVGEVSPAVENILRRNFHAEKPNRKWLTDITEFRIPAGKVYLSPIIDCFDGMPITWTIGTSPSAELTNTMLDRAIARLGSNDKPIVHSDRGGHYRWIGWISRMESSGLTRSMSRKGCSPDNSACEGFFGRIKNEIFYGRDWKNWTLDDFMYYLDRYLNWFCNERIKLGFNGKSPMKRRLELGYA